MTKTQVFICFLIAAVITLGYSALRPNTTGGSSAPSYAVAGDPNYAVAVYSTTTTGFTLGALTASTSSKVIAFTLPRGLSYGLKLGDTCAVQLSSASSSNGWSGDAQITSISNLSSTVSATFFNGTSTATTVATGTLTVACQHY